MRGTIARYARPESSGRTKHCIRVEVGTFGPLPAGNSAHPRIRLELDDAESAQLLAVLIGDAPKVSVVRKRPGSPLKRLRCTYTPGSTGGFWIHEAADGSSETLTVPFDDNDALAIAKLLWCEQTAGDREAYAAGLLSLVRTHAQRVIANQVQG